MSVCLLNVETLVFSHGNAIKMDIFSHDLQFGEIINGRVLSKNRRCDLGEFLFAEHCCLSEVVSLFLVRPAWLPRTILLHCKGFNEDHVVKK